jgi:hypothetical protein
MEQDLDAAGHLISRLQSELTGERHAYDAIKARYTLMISAAENLQQQIDAASFLKDPLEASLARKVAAPPSGRRSRPHRACARPSSPACRAWCAIPPARPILVATWSSPMQIEGYSSKKLRPAPMMMSPNPYRKSSPLSQGTEGPNPPSSTGESPANREPPRAPGKKSRRFYGRRLPVWEETRAPEAAHLQPVSGVKLTLPHPG